MKTLNGMARELFNRYSEQHGVMANWEYLSSERKAAWMKDALFVAKYYLENLKAEIKPIPPNVKSATVYEAGFNDGVRSERTSFNVLVEDLYENLITEYEHFKHQATSEKR